MIYYVCLYVLSQSFIFTTFQEFLLCSLSSWKSILPWHHWEPAHQGSKPSIDRLSVCTRKLTKLNRINRQRWIHSMSISSAKYFKILEISSKLFKCKMDGPFM